MAIVAGFDVDRAQITFDALDTETGEVSRGRIDATPAAVARWTERFAGRGSMSRSRLARAGCSSATRWCLRVRCRIWPSRSRRVRCEVASGAPRPIARTRAGCASCSLTAGCPRRGSRPSTCASGARARLRHTLIGERTQWMQRIQATLFQHGVGGPRRSCAPAPAACSSTACSCPTTRANESRSRSR